MYDKHDDQYIRADSHLCEGCNEVLTISIETIMASTSLHDESHLNCPPPPPAAEGMFVQIGQDGSKRENGGSGPNTMSKPVQLSLFNFGPWFKECFQLQIDSFF